MSFNLNTLSDVPKDLPKGAWHFFQLIRDNFNQLKDNTQEDWKIPVLLNSWESYGTAYELAGYRKDNQGYVHIKGLVKGGTPGQGSVVFNLPLKYRPDKELVFGSVAYGPVVARIDISRDGYVIIVNGNTTWTSLDGISFYATH